MINFKIFDINFAVSVGFTGIICLMLYVDKVGLMFPTTLAVFLPTPASAVSSSKSEGTCPSCSSSNLLVQAIIFFALFL